MMITSRVRLAVPALLIALSTLPAAVRAETRPGTGVVWEAQPVRHPVEPAQVRPVAPFCPDAVPETQGALIVGPGRAATFWIDSLRLVRVRTTTPGARGHLRFARIVGEGSAHAVLEEPGALVAVGTWYLAQPPGGGAVWTVSADAPVEIVVERPDRRAGRAAWEDAQRAILAWIDDGGAPPTIPLAPGSQALAARLQADAVAGEVLARLLAPGARPAVAAWRKASALAELTLVRPFLRPVFATDELEAELAGLGEAVAVGADAGDAGRPWRLLAAGAGRWRIQVDAPGALRIETRGLLQGAPTRTARLEVRAAGAPLGARSFEILPLSVTGEEGAFPTSEPMRSDRGPVGARRVLTVPLPAGVREVEVAVTGGPLLLRVTAATRRRLLDEAVAGEGSAEAWRTRGRAALDGDTSPAARLLADLLDVATGRVPQSGARAATSAPGSPVLAALAIVTRIQGALGDAAAGTLVDQVRALLASARDPERLLAWDVRLKLLRRLSLAGQDQHIRRLLDGVGEPPREHLAALAELLPEPTLIERFTSRELALLDLAWRHMPLAPEVRERYQEAWRARSAWRLVPPDRGADTIARWIERQIPAGEPIDATEPGLLFGLTPGKSRRFVAPRSAIEADRPALLRAFVRAPGAFGLEVDGRAVTTIGVGPVEAVELAVRPGEHQLTLTGAAGTEAFVALLPGKGAIADPTYARIRSLWPLRIGEDAVRYPLPDPQLGNLVQVQLRAISVDDLGSVDVQVRTDTGASWPLRFTPGRADARSAALDPSAPGPISAPVSFVLRLPPGVRAVWLESRGRPLFASVSVRRPRSVSPPAPTRAPAVPATAAAATSLARLAELSHEIAAAPGAPGPLVVRADLLLELGEPELARQDLVRLIGLRAASAHAAAIDEIYARLEALAEPSHLPLPAPRGLGAVPTPLAPPGSMSPADVDAWLPVVTTARERGSASALAALPASASPATAALRARLLVAGGRSRDAARGLLDAYTAAPSWPLGLATAQILTGVLREPAAAEGTAALAYGLARQLTSEGEHPALRQLLLAARRLSRWQAVTRVDASAGEQRVTLAETEDPSSSSAVRRALVPAPWPDAGAHLVSPGSGAILDLDLAAPTAVTLDAFCVELYSGGLRPLVEQSSTSLPAPARPTGCTLRWRIDNGAEATATARLGVTTAVLLGGVPAGRHQIEVQLDVGDRGRLAEVRFLSDRLLADGAGKPTSPGGLDPITIRRRSRLFLTTPSEPVVLTVAGPTTLRVEGRSTGDRSARTLRVEVASRRGTFVRPIELDRTVDRTLAEAGLSAPVSALVLLPDAVPYRITLRPDAGSAGATLAFREDLEGAVLPAAPRWTDRVREANASASAGAELLAWPALPELALVDGGRDDAGGRQALGTLSAGVAVGRDELGDEDDVPALDRLEVTLAWRRRIATSAWLRVTPLARLRDELEPVYGGRVDLELQDLPLGLRARAGGRGLVQRVGGASEHSLAAVLRLDRPLRLARDLLLIPSLAGRVRDQSAEGGVAELGLADPQIASVYGRAHRRAIESAVALDWRPLQDQIGSLAVGATSNEDARSVDHAWVALGWRGLFPTGALAEVRYRPNRRLEDPDRTDAYWRHDLSAGVEWAVSTGRTGRFVLALHDRLYLASERDARHEVLFALRYDFLGGRGLDDLLPSEADFRELLSPVAFAGGGAP